MNYKEIKEQFEAEYRMLCAQMKLTPFDFAEPLVYRWIDEAAADIQRRTRLVTMEIVFSTDEEDKFCLPDDFGGVISLRQGRYHIPLTLNDESGYFITDTPQGERMIIIRGFGNGPFSMRYYPESPLMIKTEGDGEAGLPPSYHRAIIYYLLARPFSNMEEKYEAAIRAIKNNSYTNNRSHFNYNFSQEGL